MRKVLMSVAGMALLLGCGRSAPEIEGNRVDIDSESAQQEKFERNVEKCVWDYLAYVGKTHYKRGGSIRSDWYYSESTDAQTGKKHASARVSTDSANLGKIPGRFNESSLKFYCGDNNKIHTMF